VTTPLNIRLPTPSAQYDAQNERELRRQLEMYLAQLGRGASTADGVIEFYPWNSGSVLVAGESDWPYVPGDFTLTSGEIVTDPAGTLTFNLYWSTYGTWDTWTLVNPTPITLTASDKAVLSLTGWTVSYTGGAYFKLAITGTPASVTKGTISILWEPN